MKHKKLEPNIFDNVYRTIASKMPFLLIPLINDQFGTNYPEDVEIEQLKNEMVDDGTKIITDSILKIGDRIFHIECQSRGDSRMLLRMVSYDFSIAMEQAFKRPSKVSRIRFPESAVLYLTHTAKTPDYLSVEVEMPDGQIVVYKTKVIRAQEYTQDEIFQKNLLILLPFYILRYERKLPGIERDPKKLKALLEEYENIRSRLEQMTAKEDQGSLYTDLNHLIIKIANHVLRDSQKVKREVKNIMGGKVLKLESERLMEKGVKKGKAEGIDAVILAVKDLRNGVNPSTIKKKYGEEVLNGARDIVG